MLFTVCMSNLVLCAVQSQEFTPALHFVDGKAGIKDFDAYLFFGWYAGIF